MNKTAIKNFAVWARKKLMADITYRAGLLGVSEKGVMEPLPQSTQDLQFFDIGTKEYAQVAGNEIKQRNALVKALREKERTADYETAFKAIIEEASYTWFNRLIAIRFMEINDYLPSGIRVLSSETPDKREPDMVTTPFDTDMEFSAPEQDKIMELKEENRLDELFRMLFIKQCNKLHEILPELFEETLDYTELLLNISFTDKDGIVSHLVNDIAEEDFDITTQDEDGKTPGQVEIIGWMYQYYNDERKNEIINIYTGTVKKEDIPAATQLFTTDWVVRYMVDNSLGRYWIERHPESRLAEKLTYFVTPKNGNVKTIEESLKPEELRFFDPCMGSGHILIYAFEVLMYIYEECGYTERDAAVSIVENNLFGLDIDDRAAQLAYFAVMMKARSYDRRFLSRGIVPNIAAIQESNGINTAVSDNMTENMQIKVLSEYLTEKFRDAKELGSIITLESKDYGAYAKQLDEYGGQDQITIGFTEWMLNTRPLLKKLAKQAELLSNRYQVVCTNPPYLNKFEGKLKKFITENYKDYAGDLFSVFIYRNLQFCTQGGYCGYMTPFVWMFIKTYEKLRKFIIENKSITTLIQMEYSAFEEATVPICSFVLQNSEAKEDGLYFKLSDFKGGMEVQRQKVLEAIADKNCGFFFEANQTNFDKIPGSPVAYWWKNYNIFSLQTVQKYYESAGRNKTHNNELYTRSWWEILDNAKWQPYANGGSFRRWAGNDIDVVDWSSKAKEYYEEHGGLYNQKYCGRQGICWNLITSYKNGFRIKKGNHHYSSASPTIIRKEVNFDYWMVAFLNSIVASSILSMYNPTLNTTVSDVLYLPIKKGEEKIITSLAEACTNLSQGDWDAFEISWDFKKHPLV